MLLFAVLRSMVMICNVCKILQDRSTASFDRVNELMLSRPSAMVFIDCDNCGLLRSSLESYVDSEFLTRSASVHWRSLGDSAFPKKLSPQQIPVSIDLGDSIIGFH